MPARGGAPALAAIGIVVSPDISLEATLAFMHRAQRSWNVMCLLLLARLPRSTVLPASARVPLTILQPVLAIAPRPEAPAVAALHAVNALAIVLLAAVVAQRSRSRI